MGQISGKDVLSSSQFGNTQQSENTYRFDKNSRNYKTMVMVAKNWKPKDDKSNDE